MDFKRKVTVTATILIIIVTIVTAFAVIQIKTSQGTEQPDMAEYEAQAQKVFDQAYVEIQQIRNVSIPKVNLIVVTKQWAIDTWGKGYADPDLTNILREEHVYKGLMMMPQNGSLYEANVNWAGNFGAASWGGQIYVVKENFDPWHKDATASFIHELTHIWQPNLPSSKSFDEEKAHAALVEGDASFMGDYYKNITKNTTPSPSLAIVDGVPLFLISNPALRELHLDTPQTISYLNWFPYTYGTPYIDAIFKQNGWTSVNHAYDSPPNSTEQILHPEKYFGAENPQQVATPTLVQNSWTQIKKNTYGEYFIQVMLANWINSNESKKAAAGWAGDDFTYYESGSDFLFTWNIKWDTSCDASEFYVAFFNMMNATKAEKQNCTHWLANGTYLSINWNQDLYLTRIAVSTVESSVIPSAFA